MGLVRRLELFELLRGTPRMPVLAGAGVGREISWLKRFLGALRSGGNALRDFEGDGAHLFVDEAVRCEDDRAAELVGPSREIGDFSASFLDEQDSGRGVPLLEAEFPEAVEAAGGDRGKIERGGAIAAHPVGALREVTVVLKIRAGFAVAHRKTGAEQTGGKCCDSGDVDFFAVESGAFSARGAEKLFVERIEDDGGEKRVSLCERDGNAEAGVAVREVGGAVERIDVPAKLRSRSALMARSFFGCNSMVGKEFAQPLDD